MASLPSRWQILPPAPQDFSSTLPELHPLLVHALYHRGLHTQEAARNFLAGYFAPADPFRLAGVSAAVSRILQAIKNRELISIYGDFDADGVAGCALLVQTFTSLGSNAIPYIPHRIDEGYGLNIRALDKLAKQGVKLVITVDCGVRSVEEVKHAQQRGMDVIVTDHHSLPEELPPAQAVINPRIPESAYPEKNLCGVGVAFKLAQALLRMESQVPGAQGIKQIAEEDILDLVALGTVTDLAPLKGENRALVKQGIEQMRQKDGPRRLGLRALIATSGLHPQDVDTQAIGYILGPRLNAAGRMGDAMVAYKLLSTSAPEEAQNLAQELEEKNRERQATLNQVWMKAREQVLERAGEPLLWAAGSDLKSGVIGLAASRLSEQFYRPAVVVELGERESRGSARSIPEFHITRALDQCQDILLRYGGHSTAAGFTVENKNLDALQERLRDVASKGLAGLELLPSIAIDFQIPLSSLRPGVFFAARLLEPTGVGNPPLILLSKGVEVREAKAVGENHLKLIISDGRIVWDAMAFGRGPEAAGLPKRIDLVYSPEIERWNGEERFRLTVLDLRAAG